MSSGIAEQQIRQAMAGRLVNPNTFPKIVDLLNKLTPANELTSFAEFRKICLEPPVNMEVHAPVIDDVELFIRRLWAATKAARNQQSIQPCW